LFLNDWSHQTVDELYSYAETSGPPTLDNGLINGTNTYNGSGSRFETTFSSGTKYLIRVVNAAVDSHFKFSIDNHTMTVVATDFVPITPFTSEYISIGMGQRYDIIVEANQTTADYWMRSIPQTTCSENSNTNDIKGIVRYNSDSTSDPTSTVYSLADDCDDMDMSLLVPYLTKNAGSETVEDDLAVAISNVNNLFKWSIGGTSMVVEWADPTLLQVYNNQTSWTNSSGVIELATANEWAFFIIETTNAVP